MLRSRNIATLSTGSSVTGSQLATEGLRLMRLELEMIEGWAKLQNATQAKTHETLRAQIVMAATPEQRTELGVYFERVSQLRRKMRM